MQNEETHKRLEDNRKELHTADTKQMYSKVRLSSGKSLELAETEFNKFIIYDSKCSNQDSKSI